MQHEKPESLTMNLSEFAKMTSNSKGHIYNLARRDLLPVKVIRLGRRMILSRKEVLALLVPVQKTELPSEDNVKMDDLSNDVTDGFVTGQRQVGNRLVLEIEIRAVKK